MDGSCPPWLSWHWLDFLGSELRRSSRPGPPKPNRQRTRGRWGQRDRISPQHALQLQEALATPFQKPPGSCGRRDPCFLCSVKHAHHLLAFRILELGQERTAHSEPQWLGLQLPHCPVAAWAEPSLNCLKEALLPAVGVARTTQRGCPQQAGMCV